jgi:hypothetical protein
VILRQARRFLANLSIGRSDLPERPERSEAPDRSP